MKKIELTQVQIDEMKRMYNEELCSSQKISEKTGLSKPTVIKILKENGVAMGPAGRRFIGGKKVADKKYRQKNKEYLDKYTKNWYEENKEYRKEYLREYREKNIEKIRERKRNYEKNRKDNDPLYKLIANFRTAIYTVLKENNMNKYGHYFDILQYSPEELANHLEKQFTDGMTWENYGEWHVDHIMPCASFDLSDPVQQRTCFRWTNLQPLWAADNIRKSDNYAP